MAKAVAHHPALDGVESVFTSPAGRALHTAEAIALVHGQRITVDERFREMSFGDWETLRPSDVPDPAGHRRWVRDPAYFSPPAGETGLQVMARALAAIRDATEGRDAVAVVSHKAPIRLIVAYFLGLPPSRYRDIDTVAVGSVTHLTVSGGQGRLHTLGDISHLPEPWQADPDRATWHEPAAACAATVPAAVSSGDLKG